MARREAGGYLALSRCLRGVGPPVTAGRDGIIPYGALLSHLMQWGRAAAGTGLAVVRPASAATVAQLGLADLRGVSALAERCSLRTAHRDQMFSRPGLRDAGRSSRAVRCAAMIRFVMILKASDRRLRRQGPACVCRSLAEVIEEVRAGAQQSCGRVPQCRYAIAANRHTRLCSRKESSKRDMQERVVDILVVHLVVVR